MIDWLARGLVNKVLTSLTDYVKIVDLPTSFVSPTSMTVANLLTTYPASSTYVGKYVRVTDLWGSTDEIMRCSYDGTTYYWRPQRTDYAVTNASTSGAITLNPLVTPPQIFMTGTLLGDITVTPSVTNAWPGAEFIVTSKGTLGIFNINITGLVGANVPLLTGASKTITYTSTGWRTN